MNPTVSRRSPKRSRRALQNAGAGPNWAPLRWRETDVTIGLLHMEFSIPGSRSLKDKRRAMNSLKSRLRNRYNCSVAEIGFKDKWARAQLAVCVISDESAHVHSQLNEIVRFASNHHAAELMDYNIETM